MTDSLAGKLLVASPGLDDPNFRRTVVLIVRHDDDGAFGLVLNRPVPAARVADHLPEFGRVVAEPPVVFVGGPVEPGSAFALGRFAENASLEDSPVFPGVRLLTLAAALPPTADAIRVFSGYSGWGAGQLEEELRQSAWFVVDPVPSDVVTVAPGDLWREVLRRQSGALAMFALYPDSPGLN